MPSSPCLRKRAWYNGVEVGALLFATPFLLFPAVRPAATVIACLLMTLTLLLCWARESAAPVTPLNGPLALWGLTIAVGTGVTAFPDATLPKSTGLLLGFWVWLVMVRTVRSSRQIKQTVWGVTLLGVVVAAQGLLTTRWPAKVPVLNALVTRLPETLVALPGGPEGGVSANQLGGAVVVYLPLALSIGMGLLTAAGSTRPKARYLLSAATLVGGVTVLALLLLSQSRSAWIGGLAGGLSLLGLWSVQLPRGKLRATIRVGLLLGILGAMGTGLWLGTERLEQLWQEPAQLDAVGGVGTLSFRFEVWRWALYAIMDFPFTGCGLGTFREVGRLLYPMDIPPNYDYAHAHNIFLQVALDTGIPGLIAYLALLGVAAVMAWRVARTSPEHRPLALGLLGGLIALHAYGLTDALAPGSKPGLIFWAMLGLITALWRTSQGANPEAQTLDAPPPAG